MDVVALQAAKADAKKCYFDQRRMVYVRSCPVPAELGWDNAFIPLALTITESLNGLVVGSIGMTARQLFDLKSTARTAPAATYYVSTSGLDSNDGLTAGTPFRSIWKAVDAANAGGVKALINVGAGEYPRGNSFIGGSNAGPTVDMAIIADNTNGTRAVTGPWDAASGFAADATYTKCYSKAVANCTRVLDRLTTNRFGNLTELTQVATAALCDATPDSWAIVGGTTLYVHRRDGLAVTDANTRYFRAAQNFQLRQQVNVLVEGFDLQGSDPNYNVFHIISPAVTPPATPNVVIASNCSFKYGGSAGAVNGRGFAAVNWYGLIAAFNCQSDANANDAYGLHNLQNDVAYMLTVNCSGFDIGRGAVQSVNGWTIHEFCKGIDVAGNYQFSRGGTVHNINSSKAYLLGTYLADDQGDAAAGGGIPPVAVRAADNALILTERVRINMPPGTLAYQAASSNSVIKRKDCTPVRQADAGLGTFGTF